MENIPFYLEKMVAFYESLTNLQRCVYDKLYVDISRTYGNSELKEICWTDDILESEKNKPVSKVKKEIELKFSEQFFEDNEENNSF
jgi:hypothetical protein